MRLKHKHLRILRMVAMGEGFTPSLRIRDSYREIYFKNIGLGSLWVGLKRLEDKGLIASEYGEGTEDRNGNRTKLFAITEEGREFASRDLFRTSFIKMPTSGIAWAEFEWRRRFPFGPKRWYVMFVGMKSTKDCREIIHRLWRKGTKEEVTDWVGKVFDELRRLDVVQGALNSEDGTFFWADESEATV